METKNIDTNTKYEADKQRTDIRQNKDNVDRDTITELVLGFPFDDKCPSSVFGPKRKQPKKKSIHTKSKVCSARRHYYVISIIRLHYIKYIYIYIYINGVSHYKIFLQLAGNIVTLKPFSIIYFLIKYLSYDFCLYTY